MIVAIGVTGCSQSGSEVVGKWKPVVNLSDDQKNDPGWARRAAALQMMTIELTADHRFTGMMMEGTWELKGSTVQFQPEKVAGIDVKDMPESTRSKMKEGSMDMSLSADKKTMTSIKHTPGSPQVKYVKQK